MMSCKPFVEMQVTNRLIKPNGTYQVCGKINGVDKYIIYKSWKKFDDSRKIKILVNKKKLIDCCTIETHKQLKIKKLKEEIKEKQKLIRELEDDFFILKNHRIFDK